MIKQALILCGGFGTRLKTITNRPKSLIKINNKNFIEYLLDELSRQKISKVILLTGYKSKTFRKLYHKKKYKNIDIICSEEKYPLGTAGALANAYKLLDKNFILLNGDTFFRINLDELYHSFNEKKNCHAMIAVKTVKNIGRFGSLKLSKNGLIRGFSEKNKKNNSKIINAGVYLFNRKLFKFKTKFTSLEKDIFPILIKDKTLYGKKFDDVNFIDIGVPKDLEKTSDFIFKETYKPAIFFDRDGTINKDIGYLHKKNDFIWNKTFIDAIRYLKRKYYIFVVTNQSGIGRGYYTEDDVKNLHDYMDQYLLKRNVYIDDYVYAPFFKDSKFKKYRVGRNLRKPNTGMIKILSNKWNIDLKNSIFIGDNDVDAEIAKRVKIKFFKVTFKTNLKKIVQKI